MSPLRWQEWERGKVHETEGSREGLSSPPPGALVPELQNFNFQAAAFLGSYTSRYSLRSWIWSLQTRKQSAP